MRFCSFPMRFFWRWGFKGESLQWAPQWDFAISQWDFSGGGALKGNLYNEPPNEIMKSPHEIPLEVMVPSCIIQAATSSAMGSWRSSASSAFSSSITLDDALASALPSGFFDVARLRPAGSLRLWLKPHVQYGFKYEKAAVLLKRWRSPKVPLQQFLYHIRASLKGKTKRR